MATFGIQRMAERHYIVIERIANVGLTNSLLPILVKSFNQVEDNSGGASSRNSPSMAQLMQIPDQLYQLGKGASGAEKEDGKGEIARGTTYP